jgi:glycosyltransferase involved in cell wall biosynthesis
MRLIVASICRNEEGTVGEVLDGIPREISGVDEIACWVIDDGSLDGTAELARARGAVVHGDGAEAGLAERFRELVDRTLADGAEVLVHIDGDLQFDPADIPRLVEPLVAGEADVVAADRFSAEGGGFRRPRRMPRAKYLGNRLGAWVISRLSGHRFHDVTCGFRAYGREALFALNTNGMHTYTQESFQMLAMKGLRIRSVPIVVRYFPERRSRVVSSVFQYVWVSAVNILRSYRDFAPLRFFGWLGLVPFVVGTAALGFIAVHWARTGDFSPYKFVGFAGVYFVTLGIAFWALGLVADMLSRLLRTEERVLELLKRSTHAAPADPPHDD